MAKSGKKAKVREHKLVAHQDAIGRKLVPYKVLDHEGKPVQVNPMNRANHSHKAEVHWSPQFFLNVGGIISDPTTVTESTSQHLDAQEASKKGTQIGRAHV